MSRLSRWVAPRMSARQRRRVARIAAGLVVPLVAVTACSSSGGSTTGSSGASSNLVMQFAGPPISLNPALGGTGDSVVFYGLAYDSLIYLSGDGDLVPDLATSWKYTDQSNKVFELTLRSGVKFTDGKPLTAEAAVASMNYFLKAGGGDVHYAGAVESVTASDPMTVRITYSAPNPDAALSLTQFYGFGSIIGPDGLADPNSLLTSSDGTGSYIYDNTSSVANSHYEYDKNPHYFNPSAQHFHHVSLRVISDPQAVLSAARTNQIQFGSGDASTASAAKQAKLGVLAAPFFNWGLYLLDTQGVLSKPLGDPRVRQAIGYALDRKSLANALGGQYAKPSTEIMLPGTDGYVGNFGFDYDLDKAKSLMAEAGYPDGFPLTVLTENILDHNTTYSQALADALGAIGIKVNLHVESTGIGQLTGDSLSKKYPALVWAAGGADIYQTVGTQVAVGLTNPFGHTDPQLQSILDQADASSGSQRTQLYQQVTKRFNELGWFIPAFSTQNLWYVSPNLIHVSASVVNPNPLPEAPTAKLAWQIK